MKPVVVFGTGKVGEVLCRHLRVAQERDLVAFTTDAAFQPPGAVFQGLPTVPFETLESAYPPARFDLIVAVGYHELNAVRRRIFEQAKAKGYALASFVSPRAAYGDWLDIGEGCVILDHVTVEPGVKIGNNVVVWSGALIGHHTVIEDHCWVAGHAVFGGSAKLGSGSFVGLGAVVGNEVEIGARSFLGAGVVVTKCADPKSVFVQRDTECFRLDSDHFMRISKIR